MKGRLILLVLIAALGVATTASAARLDFIRGTDGPDALNGTAGNDLIRARAGNDNIRAHDGKTMSSTAGPEMT
jgi:Ca2+-binding RTX toxin-like protein